MIIRHESIKNIWHEIEPLAKANYEEAKFYDIIGQYRLDKEKLCSLEDTGHLLFISFRNEENNLVGYSYYYLMKSLLSQDIIAENGALYLQPQERKGLVISKILQRVENILQNKKVNVIIHKTTTQRNIGKLFQMNGFNLSELTYIKRV